jgi:sugar (pentulose or hexulose) kinase
MGAAVRGATKSDLWCQIQADVHGKPTSVLREGEGTAQRVLGGPGRNDPAPHAGWAGA